MQKGKRLTPKQKKAALAREAIKAAFIAAHRTNGANIQNSCMVAGISRQTYYDWNDIDHVRYDQDFHHACQELAEECVDNVESSLYKNALEGDSRAQVFYLCNKGRKRGWANSSNVKVNGAMVTSPIPNLTYEQAMDLAKEIGEPVNHDPGLSAE